MGTALFSSNGNYYIDVDAAVSSQDQAGNYSTIYWRVMVFKTFGSGFYSGSGGSGSADSNIGGNPDLWNASGFGYDFRNGSNTGNWTFASGHFTLYHNADGYADFWVNGGMTLPSLGSASAGSGTKSAPRIPKVPQPTTPLSLTEVTATSMKYRFSGNGDGGSAIQEWQIGYGVDPNNVQLTMSSPGTSVVPSLRPGTMYYFWSRGRNGIGWGPWSTRMNARTLAGAKVQVGAVYKDAVPYVKVAGIWRLVDPYVNVKGTWKLPG